MVGKRPLEKSRRVDRRLIVGGVGAAGLTGAAALLYRAAPSFWQQYARERRRSVLPAPHHPRPSDWPDHGVHAAWLGHSTVLMKIDGTTLITDPVFSERAGINVGLTVLGVKRLVAPALDVAELPRIDVVLLSHAHMDHFDLPSLRALENKGTQVVTAARTADLLRPRRWGGVHEVGWGGSQQVGPLHLRAFQVNHWGARVRTDTYRGYNGYVIERGRWRVLFGGDTANTDAFRQVRSFGPVHLGLMPIGAYNPWRYYHCTPEEAWQMSNDAGAERILPIHHQTFVLSREPVMEPIERLLTAAGRSRERVAAQAIGHEVHLT